MVLHGHQFFSWSYGNSYKTEKRAASAVATVALEELPVLGGANGGAAETSSHWQLPGAADADVGWLATTRVVEQELVEAWKTAGKPEMRLGRHADMIVSWFCITKFIKKLIHANTCPTYLLYTSDFDHEVSPLLHKFNNRPWINYYNTIAIHAVRELTKLAAEDSQGQ